MSRLIAVGDIHGEITKLRALIELIRPTPEDELVFLGDYIDRGEDSVAVLDFLIQKDRAYYPNWRFLMGNHEVMMFQALTKPTLSSVHLWSSNGGETTQRDYEKHYPESGFPDDHARFFSRLLPFCVKDGFVFVHAGLDPERPIGPQLQEPYPSELIWGRDHLKHPLDKWEEGITVVCGHTPQRNGPLIRDKVICVDTGAAFTDPKKIKKGYGSLSAIDIRSKRIYRVGPEVTA